MSKLEIVKNFLFHGGITKEQNHEIRKDIDESNRSSVILYSIVFAAFTFVLFVITSFRPDLPIARNKIAYLVIFGVTFVIALANILLGKKVKFVVPASCVVFDLVILGFGFILTYNHINEITAAYMVILFATPLLLIEPAVVMASVVLIMNGLFIAATAVLQDPEIFAINLTNSIVFCVAGTIIGAISIRTKVKKLYADHTNVVLMRTDILTGLLNRHAYSQECNSLANTIPEATLVCVAFDLNKLKLKNDMYGHEAGDALLIAAANAMTEAFAKYGNVYRIGGDEFTAILRCTEDEIKAAAQEFEDIMIRHNEEKNDCLSVAYGYACGCEKKVTTFESLTRIADNRMYEHKEQLAKAFEEETGKSIR